MNWTTEDKLKFLEMCLIYMEARPGRLVQRDYYRRDRWFIQAFSVPVWERGK